MWNMFLLNNNAIFSFILTLNQRCVLGGIVLTASHNPGGIRNDFGIKYNIENGGPAPDQLSNTIYELTTKITQFKFTPDLDCDFSAIGTQTFEVKCFIIWYEFATAEFVYSPFIVIDKAFSWI